MSEPAVTPKTAGLAYRVSILGTEQVEAYRNVHVILDARHQVAHVFAADRQTHYLTLPIAIALIEWADPAPLQPQLRLPPLGPGAFEQMGEQMQRMIQGMQHGMGMG